jgi:misacylated tRNA(Ala) deacylase
MAKALYMDDSYLKEFDAVVKSVSGKYVVLDQTAFFPKGGGVEWDTGVMRRKSDNKEFKVVYVGKFKGEISHELNEEGLKEGDEIKGAIDWERRYKLMRYHTGTHVFTGVLFNDYNLQVTGNQLTTKKARVDLNMDEMDIDLLKQAIEKANNIIANDLPVEIYYKSRKEAEKDPELFKLAIGFPHNIDNIRIVDIKGFDAQADGGCHVKSLKEIGKLVYKNAVNKGKNNRRVYYTVE